MSFNKSLLIAAVLLIGVLQINSAALGLPKNSTSNGNDLILGEETPNSRLIHRERATLSNFYWSGPFTIVKVEALDQTGGLGGHIYNWFLDSSGFFMYMEGCPIDFIVKIYVENFPHNDVIQGNLTDNSVLLLNERVTGGNFSEHFIIWRNTSNIITRLEAFDQTNGSGGILEYVSGGVDRRYVNMYFTARFVGSSIDFIVNIYGELVATNDRVYGELTNTSILVHTMFGCSGACSGCGESIPSDEMVMRTTSQIGQQPPIQQANQNPHSPIQHYVFHIKCFRCSKCTAHLRAGDRYYMLAGTLVCEQDWHKLQKLSTAQSGTPPVRKGKVGRPRRSRD